MTAGMRCVWADGFGIWHTRVEITQTGQPNLIVARKMLRDALNARYDDVRPTIWKNPIRVPELDTPGTAVYREGD